MTIGQSVWLQRPSEDVPWGFRLSGGRDYQEPIKIQRVSYALFLIIFINTNHNLDILVVQLCKCFLMIEMGIHPLLEII